MGGAVLYCTVLYCTVLYCNVLYCTAQVTHAVWAGLDLVDAHHSVLLIVLAALAATNIILALLVTARSALIGRQQDILISLVPQIDPSIQPARPL